MDDWVDDNDGLDTDDDSDEEGGKSKKGKKGKKGDSGTIIQIPTRIPEKIVVALFSGILVNSGFKSKLADTS